MCLLIFAGYDIFTPHSAQLKSIGFAKLSYPVRLPRGKSSTNTMPFPLSFCYLNRHYKPVSPRLEVGALSPPVALQRCYRVDRVGCTSCPCTLLPRMARARVGCQEMGCQLQFDFAEPLPTQEPDHTQHLHQTSVLK
jgi:hypothetical protein